MTITLKDGRTLECMPKTESSPEQFSWPDDAERRREYELLKKNAHFIFENREKVLSNSKIFFAPVNVMSGGAYIGAFVKPTLGSYVEWWIARGKDELALYVSGSPLSGANVSKSITKSGKMVELKPDGMFLNLVKEFNSFHKCYKDIRGNIDAYTLEEAISQLKQSN